MPAPTTTDKYPLWLKQGLQLLVEKPSELLPKRLEFIGKNAAQVFQRNFYGYQSALRKEGEEGRLLAERLGQLMLVKVSERTSPKGPAHGRESYPEGEEPSEVIYTYQIILRDEDPRLLLAQQSFQTMIDEDFLGGFGDLSSDSQLDTPIAGDLKEGAGEGPLNPYTTGRD